MQPDSPTSGNLRSVALERMTQALRAAQAARDRGADVREVRVFLKESRAAFETGDFQRALDLANRVVGLCGGEVPMWSTEPATVVEATATRATALSRMTQALEAAKAARERGADIHEVRALMVEARSSFEAGNYDRASGLADRVIEVCGSGGPAAPGGRGAPHEELAARAPAYDRIAKARREVKRARRRGFVVSQADQTVAEARRAYDAGDYRRALKLADFAIELCGPGPQS